MSFRPRLRGGYWQLHQRWIYCLEEAVSSFSSLSLLMNENISYIVYYVYCANLLLTNPRQLIITEQYSFHRCMLVKNLFKETRPLRPNIINVVINVRAVPRNVFKIRKKSILIPILHGARLYCSRFRQGCNVIIFFKEHNIFIVPSSCLLYTIMIIQS